LYRFKKNIALGAIMSKFEYLRLADTIAAEIASGALKPGDRLPPQRSFAYERKIAVSTASRVYTELLRRGLVVGEVGRGTFISGEARRGITAATEPNGARIDLEFNYPLLPHQAAMIAKSLEGLERPDAFEIALRPSTSTGTPAARSISAAFLARKDWLPGADQIVFTANGRQCIAAALAALVPPGGRCGVEALTYPFIKGIAARLGMTLVPLAMDEHGVRPDAVQKAHREAHLSALYLQPTIQNPLGITMPAARRADLLRVVEKLDLTIIEDAVYGFLDDQAPLAALAPDRCVVLDSLSKKVAPVLALGFIVTPQRLRENVMAAVRSGGWTASGFAFAAAQRLMGDGTASELSRLKRIDAARRQQLAAKLLAGFEIQANAKAYHLWLTLPPHWRSQTFVAAAARRDIALTPSTTFAVAPGHAPNAVRLALGAPTLEQLETGLRTLSGILSAKEEDFDLTE
jgi:DNA-binding transcriptional MocR family regulator